jgi:hypothetical protein
MSAIIWVIRCTGMLIRHMFQLINVIHVIHPDAFPELMDNEAYGVHLVMAHLKMLHMAR